MAFENDWRILPWTGELGRNERSWNVIGLAANQYKNVGKIEEQFQKEL